MPEECSRYDDDSDSVSLNESFIQAPDIQLKGTRPIRMDDVIEALMTLPRLLQLIAENMEETNEKEWALSTVSPFHYSSKGARIPNI